MAQDRAAQLDSDAIYEEIRKGLRKQAKVKGEFASVHMCPVMPGDVTDEREARLVVLDPAYCHTAKDDKSVGRKASEKILAERGAGPRLYRNTVVFLAPDKARLSELEDAIRQYLAWKSIGDEKNTLELTPFQANQAKTKYEQFDQTVRLRIPETYTWLLVPRQEATSGSPVEWDEIRLQGQDELAPRASRKLVNEEMLITKYAGTLLRMKMDAIPLWRGDHVSVKQLVDDFAQYLYLPRLKGDSVLLTAINDGLFRSLTWEVETFGYADQWDDTKQKYLGLRGGEMADVQMSGLVVKSDAVLRQFASETVPLPPQPGPGPQPDSGNGDEPGPTPPLPPLPPPPVKQPHRFYGSVKIEAKKLSSTSGTIAQEIVQHLAGLVGSNVTITLEIQATIPGGAPDHVVRTVTENCRTLGFQVQEFEDE